MNNQASNNDEVSAPPEIPESFHKARRNYSFIAGLLLALELIGFKLKGDELLFFGNTFQLLSPQAMPFVVIALLFYFGFRFITEWYQLPLERRRLEPSRVDCIFNHLLAWLAIMVYSVQRVASAQIYNSEIFTISGAFSFFMLMFIFFSWFGYSSTIKALRTSLKIIYLLIAALSICMITYTIFTEILPRSVEWLRISLFIATMSVPVYIAARLLIDMKQKA